MLSCAVSPFPGKTGLRVPSMATGPTRPPFSFPSVPCIVSPLPLPVCPGVPSQVTGTQIFVSGLAAGETPSQTQREGVTRWEEMLIENTQMLTISVPCLRARFCHWHCLAPSFPRALAHGGPRYLFGGQTHGHTEPMAHLPLEKVRGTDLSSSPRRLLAKLIPFH